MSEEKIRLYYKNAIIERYRLREQLTTAKEALSWIHDETLHDVGDIKSLSRAIRRCNKQASEALAKIKEETPK